MASRTVRSPANRATGDSTRERILEAAEQLFAREGFDRVTLRQIARQADQGNVAAVQYHFGSKAGLLSAIVDAHREEIDERRRALLARAEAEAGGEPALGTLIEILLQPLAAKLDDASGRAYLRIQAQGLTNAEMRPATRSLIRRIGALFLERGDTDSPHRSRFALLLLLHALADRAEAETAGRARRNDRHDFLVALGGSIERLLGPTA